MHTATRPRRFRLLGRQAMFPTMPLGFVRWIVVWGQ